MTFEEFFTKKRIDLALLRQAKPALYEEFRDHYAQMSEKSFDHTKKYWFNRLRKEFLLEVVEPPKAAVEKPPVAKAAEVSASAKPAAKPAGFKPRFKAGATSAPKPAETPTVAQQPAGTGKPSVAPAEKPTTPTTKPTGFKPRFKPGVTKPAAPVASAQKTVGEEPAKGPDTPKDTPEPTPAKPLGFKPRFKAGVTPPAKDAGKSEDEAAPETGSKPPLGFKPRFKAGKPANGKD